MVNEWDSTKSKRSKSTLHVVYTFILHSKLSSSKKVLLKTLPLLLACQYRELDAVKHLVERWGVNVQDAALYYNHVEDNFSNQIRIEKGSPLIAAAFEGHLDVVRYLVGKGALHGVVFRHSNDQSPSQFSFASDHFVVSMI